MNRCMNFVVAREHKTQCNAIHETTVRAKLAIDWCLSLSVPLACNIFPLVFRVRITLFEGFIDLFVHDVICYYIDGRFSFADKLS